MLLHNVWSALRLNGKGLGALAPSNATLWGHTQPSSTVIGFHQCHSYGPITPSLRAYSADAAGCNTAAHVSSQEPTSPMSLGVDQLYGALGFKAEAELRARLARLWSLSPEVLHSTTAALVSLLEPCGRDSTAHALWMLVRCPALRYWSEQQLRSSFAHLQLITSCAKLSDHDFTAAVYRHPWMLNAAAATAVVRRNPRSAASSDAAAAASLDQVSRTSRNLGPQQQQQLLPSVPFYKSLALLLVQAQAYSTTVSSSSSDVPPYVSPKAAERAVKAYATAAEAAQEFVNSAAAEGEQLLAVKSTAEAAVDWWLGPQRAKPVSYLPNSMSPGCFVLYEACVAGTCTKASFI